MIAAKSLRRIDSHRASPAETLTQRAHQELRAALLRGDFLPGTALTLRALAERLGTSIMPVREAVSRLAAEQALDNWSIKVTNLDIASRSENVVYKVTNQNGERFALRIHRP